jgi:hypothetical protein
VPYLKEHFGILSATFQWLDLPESETLVFTKYQKYQKYQSTRSTKKPKAQVQKSADQVWRGKIWIFQNLNTPSYSPQSSASLVSSVFRSKKFDFSIISIAQMDRVSTARNNGYQHEGRRHAGRI